MSAPNDLERKSIHERFEDWFRREVTRWGVTEDLTFDQIKSIAHEAYLSGYGECGPRPSLAKPLPPVPELPFLMKESGWERASDWTYEKGRWVIARCYGTGYDLWEDGYPVDGESYRAGGRFYGHFGALIEAVRAQQREARAKVSP